MQLKSLSVVVNGEVSRYVEFKSGLNLILDGSVLIDTESGNSVGKTTALRAIDYCFGANVKVFFEDAEFKVDNEIIKDFFRSNNVFFILEILSDDGSIIKVERNASVEKEPVYRLDDKLFTDDSSFMAALKERLFFSGSRKPTLRQIISRYVRHTPSRMSNALKTLHQTTSSAEYETLNLFMFHFGNPDLLTDKQDVIREVKKLKKNLAAVKQGYSKQALKQSISVVERDINEKQDEIKSFKLSESYEGELDDLQKVRESISIVAMEMSKMEVRLSVNKKAIERLEKNKSELNAQEIHAIYDEANARLGDLSKTFDDALNFHNQMIERKIEFIKKGLPELEENVSELEKSLNELLDRESLLLSELSETGSLSDLEMMQRQLNELYENKGKLEQAFETISDYENKLSDKEKQLEKINIKLSRNKEEFDKKLSIFNGYFSQYTKLLYDEEYVLYPEDNKGVYEFKIGHVNMLNKSGNVGEGTKKALIAAFDMAYISFLKKYRSQVLMFSAHDGIEEVHHNQIKTLFELVNEVSNQYIVSTLKESVEFMGKEFVDSNMVLELDEQNKFFRI